MCRKSVPVFHDPNWERTAAASKIKFLLGERCSVVCRTYVVAVDAAWSHVVSCSRKVSGITLTWLAGPPNEQNFSSTPKPRILRSVLGHSRRMLGWTASNAFLLRVPHIGQKVAQVPCNSLISSYQKHYSLQSPECPIVITRKHVNKDAFLLPALWEI